MFDLRPPWREVREGVAYALLGIGAIALLARLAPDSGWLWVGLTAAAFLVAYRIQGTYAFLTIGGVLSGLSAGLLTEGGWGLEGFFLMCLGTGLLVVDRVEPRESRWPIYPGVVLIGLGLLYWLFSSGIVAILWLPILLLTAGALLLRRSRRNDWTAVPDPTADEPMETRPPS